MREQLDCYRCGKEMAVWGPEGNPNMKVCSPCRATEALLAEPLAVRARTPQKGNRGDTMRVTEKIKFWIAWRMPHWLVNLCAVRLIAHATTGRYSDTVVPELTAMDAVKRWETP